MALGIQTNISGLENTNTLNRADRSLQSSFQKISSGKQINSAKDNAAGLAIVNRFAAQIIAASKSYQNLNDAVSYTQVAEGYAGSVNDLTTRARELAMQSGNALMTDSDRAALQKEYSQIQDEVRRISQSAEFNGQKIFTQDGSLDMPIDGNGGANDSVSLSTYDLNSQLSDFLNSDISSQANAQSSLDSIDTAQKNINSIRADYGATNNRLASAGETLQTKQLNLEASKSRILDTDYARQMSQLTRDMIQKDAATAVQGYTNFSQNQVLSLLNAA